MRPLCLPSELISSRTGGGRSKSRGERSPFDESERCPVPGECALTLAPLSARRRLHTRVRIVTCAGRRTRARIKARHHGFAKASGHRSRDRPLTIVLIKAVARATRIGVLHLEAGKPTESSLRTREWVRCPEIRGPRQRKRQTAAISPTYRDNDQPGQDENPTINASPPP